MLVNNKLIKDGKNCIVSPLTDIINESVESGVAPNAFKIPTKGETVQIGESTGLYSCFLLSPKLWTKSLIIVNKILMSYLEVMGMLSKRQFGFRKGRSTEGAADRINFVVFGW